MFKITENDKNMLLNILSQIYPLNIVSPAAFDKDLKPLIQRLVNAEKVVETPVESCEIS